MVSKWLGGYGLKLSDMIYSVFGSNTRMNTVHINVFKVDASSRHLTISMYTYIKIQMSILACMPSVCLV